MPIRHPIIRDSYSVEYMNLSSREESGLRRINLEVGSSSKFQTVSKLTIKLANEKMKKFEIYNLGRQKPKQKFISGPIW